MSEADFIAICNDVLNAKRGEILFIMDDELSPEQIESIGKIKSHLNIYTARENKGKLKFYVLAREEDHERAVTAIHKLIVSQGGTNIFYGTIH